MIDRPENSSVDTGPVMADRIATCVELKAPVSRVWRALTDHLEFGAWFRVALDGPFVLGQEATGRIAYPGYEHIVWRATVVNIVPESLFAFTWHPYAVDPNHDYSTEQPTLVEFRLEPMPGGTLLSLTESGFDKIPPGRQSEAFRRNEGGWAIQMQNIANHVGG